MNWSMFYDNEAIIIISKTNIMSNIDVSWIFLFSGVSQCGVPALVFSLESLDLANDRL